MSTDTSKRITDLAMDVLREGKEGREMELATDVLLHRADPGAFIIAKDPIPQDVIEKMRPGPIISTEPIDERLAEENGRLRQVVSAIDTYLEEAGDSELVFSHVAHLLRQAGFAQGPGMDEFFKGTNLERRS